MFLKEYALRRYGPLADSGRLVLGKFNLFYGANEHGKTLTIDAFMKILFGRAAARSFQAIRRVDENPEGYLTLELGARGELKLPEAGLLTDLIGLGAADFANIFIIRDSNLAIANEDTLYRGVTNRLTGMRSDEIRKIVEEVQALSRITASGDFKNVAPEKLKDRVGKARQLLEQCGRLLEIILAEGHARLEEELAILKEKHASLLEKVGQLTAALNRDKYETGAQSLQALEKALAAGDNLRQATDEHYRAWNADARSLEHLVADKARLEEEMKAAASLVDEARSEALSARRGHRQAADEQSRVALRIGPSLAEHDRRQALLSSREALAGSSLMRLALPAGLLLLLLTLGGTIFQPQGWLYVLLVIFALFNLAVFSILISFLLLKSRLVGMETRLLAEAGNLNFDVPDIRLLRLSLGALESKVESEADRLNEAEKDLDRRREDAIRLAEKLNESEKQVIGAEEKIKSIRQATGVGTLEELSALIALRQELRQEAEKQAAILESHFGLPEDSLPIRERLVYWEEQVESFSRYASAAPGIRYDQKIMGEANEQISGLEEKINVLQEQLRERNDELRILEKELNELIGPEEDGWIICQTAVDLEMARIKLEEWIGHLEEERSAALAAIAIFKTLEVEEEEKVSALFGAASPVSAYFSNITAGRYRAVFFNPSAAAIKIIRHDGLELDASQLSGGAYDQLYFAIRLALGEKLLGGETGFFILDDPFIKADPTRLETQLKMLFSIAGKGWQILYFSSKAEIREALADQIADGAVKLFPVSPAV